MQNTRNARRSSSNDLKSVNKHAHTARMSFPKQRYTSKTAGCFQSAEPWHIQIVKSVIHEPPHDKTNKMTCAPSEDSDQPGHPPSLISPHEESLGPELPTERTAKTLFRLGGCPG